MDMVYSLRRFKASSRLNVVGLATAFIALMLICMKIDYESNFDRCYDNYERIAMVNMSIKGDEPGTIRCMSRAAIDFILENVPGIEYGSIYSPSWDNTMFHVGDGDDISYFMEQTYGVSSDFPKVIGMRFVEGSADGLAEPGAVVISETMAEKLFPDSSAVGQYFYLDTPIWGTEKADKLKVCGVYKNFPENSQFHNHIFVPFDKHFQKGEWGLANFWLFVRLHSDVSIEDLNSRLEECGVIEGMNKVWPEANCRFHAVGISDVYNTMSGMSEFFKTRDGDMTLVLTTIALLIILTAGINLLNFSVALAPTRLRGINTRKVLGCPTLTIRLGLIAESVVTALLGWLLAVAVLALLIHVNILTFLDFTPSLLTYWRDVVLCALAAPVVGAVSGIYPAYYATSFAPAMVLKGNFALSDKGKRLRTFLISLQFIVTFVLVTVSAFIWLQNRHMRTYRLGFDHDRVVVAQLPHIDDGGSKHTLFRQMLEQHPEVEGVAFSSTLLGGKEGYSTYNYKDENSGVNSLVYVTEVSPDFPSVMGMTITKGRAPVEADSKFTDRLYFVANAAFGKTTGIDTGTLFNTKFWSRNAEVVCYVDDVCFSSRRTETPPHLFVLNNTYNKVMSNAYIRIATGSSPDKTVSLIRNAAEECFDGFSVEVSFFDDIYQQLYEKETNLQYIVSGFCLIAVLISLAGVLGLVMIEGNNRRKEVCVRKVFGATTGEVLWQFNRFYLSLTLMCCIIGIPIVWIIVTEWVQNFSLRIALSPLVFFICLLLVCGLTAGIVTLQNYRTANSNPADGLKNE